MRIQSSLVSLTTRALSESMDVNVMTDLFKDLVYDYDIYRRSGFRQSLVIPQRDAARQIVVDMVNMGLYYHFISILIQVHVKGFKGRKYTIACLNEILVNIHESGYRYDPDYMMFVEDPAIRRTKNWGALVEGKDYPLAFLQLDIAGSSKLVRKHPQKIIHAAYSDLRKIVEKSIYKRNGRIWAWEGDGGLAAFYLGNNNLHAALAGMEIINDLFVYNTLDTRLNNPLEVRIAVHSGFCRYSKQMETFSKNEVIREIIRFESKHTKPNSLTISHTVCLKLTSSLLEGFDVMPVDDRITCASYSVKLER